MIFPALQIIASTLLIEEAGLILNLAFLNSGEVSLSSAIMLNTLGILSADILLFFFGLLLFLTNKPNSLLSKVVSSLEKARVDIKVIPYSIIASRIIPGLRYPTHLSAGYGRYSFLKFFVIDLLSISAWSIVIISLGNKVLRFLNSSIVVGIIITFFIFKVAMYSKHIYEKRRTYEKY